MTGTRGRPGPWRGTAAAPTGYCCRSSPPGRAKRAPLGVIARHRSTRVTAATGGRTYDAHVGPGLQVFDGFRGQLLLVELPVNLGQLGHPEPVAVLSQDLSDATLDLLPAVGPSFVRAVALVQIREGWAERESREEKKHNFFSLRKVFFFFIIKKRSGFLGGGGRILKES